MDIPYCNGKKGYDKRGAVSARNKRYSQEHVALRVYKCDRCPNWHLTSQDPDKGNFKLKKQRHGAKQYKIDSDEYIIPRKFNVLYRVDT